MYTTAKGWTTRMLETVWYMIQKVAISFDMSSFNKVRKEMSVLEKQINTIREVADQLVIVKSDLFNLVSPRLQRLREKVSAYSFQVKWVPGKTHYITDAFLRAPSSLLSG